LYQRVIFRQAVWSRKAVFEKSKSSAPAPHVDTYEYCDFAREQVSRIDPVDRSTPFALARISVKTKKAHSIASPDLRKYNTKPVRIVSYASLYILVLSWRCKNQF